MDTKTNNPFNEKRRLLSSVQVWLKHLMKWEVSHKKLVETFEEQYVKENNTVDPNAEPLNILVLVSTFS